MVNSSKIIVVLGLFLGLSFSALAQGPPPPPADGHGVTTNEAPGGGAPVGGGLAILLGLGAAWGTRKLMKARRKEA